MRRYWGEHAEHRASGIREELALAVVRRRLDSVAGLTSDCDYAPA